jgi:cell division transport system ATP-binding protein
MIILENVSKKFGTGVYGLTNVSFTVEKGEFAFLVGPTGSGKTTIIRMLIREVMPTQGTIVVSNWNIVRLPGRKVPELRKKIGVVFQDLKLLPDRTVLENTTLPLELSGVKTNDAKKRAEEILESVGILEHANKFPVQLSGGERQRAAIARALVLSPEILLADEPTGDLDDDTAWEIVELLRDINESGTTVLMATHNTNIINKLNKRIIKLNKGVLVGGKEDNKKEDKPSATETKQEQEKVHKTHSHDESKKDDEKITDKFEQALEEKKLV